jgi:hypothetical protein
MSNIIREYIDTPISELLVKSFENDHWGLTGILRAADYRIGKTRLLILKGRNSVVDKVINRRLREGSNKPYQD